MPSKLARRSKLRFYHEGEAEDVEDKDDVDSTLAFGAASFTDIIKKTQSRLGGKMTVSTLSNSEKHSKTHASVLLPVLRQSNDHDTP